MMPAAEVHKVNGNDLFKRGDFHGAVVEYTKAIAKDASSPVYFNNRALCRIKLEDYDNALDDADRAVQLCKNNEGLLMKADFYRAQSLLGLGRPKEALRAAEEGYEIAIRTVSPSARNMCDFILRAKKAIWERDQRRRLAEKSNFFQDMQNLIYQDFDAKVRQLRNHSDNGELDPDGISALSDQIDSLRFERDDRFRNLQTVFAHLDDEKDRQVPGHMIDPITFEIFYDPVITKNGCSFERSSLLEFLKRNPVDPMTREPLSVADLRPNLALKEACSEFISENGWAADS
ncbi:uncharacterized protein V1516DRAFT_675080 [Lipomyces oligophaga]|uniref:uncharacterized protein n=1 Tax=Lipomyces oligophaga TaxID=45792 RepID=UPI0034CE2B5B